MAPSARQGRQPKSLLAATAGSSAKGGGGGGGKNKKKPSSSPSSRKKAALSSASTKAQKKVINDTNSSLDLYTYSSSIKKPRGDVDPEARPKSDAVRKGKGKGKARLQDEEHSGDDGSEEDSESSDQVDFSKNGIVEFTGIKPAGLYMGGMSDDEADGTARKIASDDDEDIDSDEAFDEDDEDDFSVKPSKANKTKKNSATRDSVKVDLNEEDVDSEDEEGGNYMDASEMFDAAEFDSEEESTEAESAGDQQQNKKRKRAELNEEESDNDDDSAYEAALNKLNSFVDGLEGSKKRPASGEVDDDDDDDDDTANGGKKRKRLILKERGEAYPEGEFVAITASERQGNDKLKLDDLLSSLSASKNPKLVALRKSLKPLMESNAISSSSSRSHLNSSGPLAAPLPGRLQDKLERSAAYEKTKEETDKWNETVRRMKGESGLGAEGARHERLTLPLMGAEGDVRRPANAAEWSAKFQPQNELEASIQKLLVTGQMSQSDLQKQERAALAALDPADLAERQAELRRQRDLMFRAERKAKRVAKIKSKAFRRIHRKAKGKGEDGGLTLEDMEDLDKIDGGDRVAEEKARMEMARARERATLKHSTKGGRWSKTVGDIHGLDEERNTAVREMVQRGDTLRQKIAGIDDDASEDEYAAGGSSDDDDDEAEGDYNSIKNKAYDELASMEAQDAATKAAAPKMKGVLNMKFMRDALAREDRKVTFAATELREKLEQMDDFGTALESTNSDQDEDDERVGVSAQVQGNLGRMVFGPSAVQPGRPAPPVTSVAASKPATNGKHSTKLAAPLAITAAPRTVSSSRSSSALKATEEDENPWLAIGDGSSNTGKVSRKMNKATSTKSSRDADRVASKVARHRSKQEDARELEKDDAQVEIDTQSVLSHLSASKVAQVVQSGTKLGEKYDPTNVTKSFGTEGEDSDESDEDDEAQHEAQSGRGPAAFRQRDLVAKAFAGDNVIADFEAEKQKEIERYAPKEEDNTLPGWGTWSGKGVKKKKNARKFITVIPGIEASKRKDASFNNVIISEKKDKKAAKYLIKDLPFPYTSAAQHEHKLRLPLGAEWATSTVVRDRTLPKVLIKPGVTIRPVAKKV